ncbi:MAG TPA: hypothetical protein VEQ60_08970 [Longimicrobium sp.]|nr:hypothetical protein [Longimicrobium sp.]
MGSTYGNVTLRGPAQEPVVQAVTEAGMTAVVSPTDQGVTVVYDCRSEADPDVLHVVTRWLSQRFGCAAWGVYVFDSDVVRYTLCRGGEVLDRYDSAPGYPEVSGGATGGNAAVLCREMQLKPADAAAVEQVLRRRRVLFEEQRHGDLMRELGHPDLGWHTRHSDFWRGEPLPEGYAREQFRIIGGAQCLEAYSFEAALGSGAAGPTAGDEGGWGWLAGAVLAGTGLWLWSRRKDRVSRRHFVALLAAGGLAAAVDASLPPAGESNG